MVFENDRVRVLDARGKPGDKTEMKSHPACVVIAITDCKGRVTLPDGQTTELEMEAGQAMYFDAVENAVEFMGTTEAHVLLVELK